MGPPHWLYRPCPGRCTFQWYVSAIGMLVWLLAAGCQEASDAVIPPRSAPESRLPRPSVVPPGIDGGFSSPRVYYSPAPAGIDLPAPPTVGRRVMGGLPQPSDPSPDPFQPTWRPQITPQGALTPVSSRPRGPLESVALEQWRLTGIVYAANQSLALVEDGTGKGFTVRIGDFIGLKSGRVTAIETGCLMVVEPSPAGKEPGVVRRHRLVLGDDRGRGDGNTH